MHERQIHGTTFIHFNGTTDGGIIKCSDATRYHHQDLYIPIQLLGGFESPPRLPHRSPSFSAVTFPRGERVDIVQLLVQCWYRTASVDRLASDV